MPNEVLSVVNRYLLRQIVTVSAATIGIGLAVLLLERVLRLFSLVADPHEAVLNVGRMLVLLLPHYLSLALPAAFFFGILLTFLRLRRDSELVVLVVAGRSLARLLTPALGLAAMLALIVAIIVGYLSPHARYAYRSMKHAVARASLTAAVMEETFIHADGLTFFAESATPTRDGLRLDKVFVHEGRPEGGSIVVTGRDGMLAQRSESGVPVLLLRQGVRAEMPTAVDQESSTLAFSNLSWPVMSGADEGFRPRGKDQRELTIFELWNAPATARSEPSRAEIAAELHGRLVAIVSVPLLPFLAAALAASGTVRGRNWSIAAGLLTLIVYYQALNFGESLAKRELLSPLIGLWLPFLGLCVVTAYLYARANRGRPVMPMTWSRLVRRRPQEA